MFVMCLFFLFGLYTGVAKSEEREKVCIRYVIFLLVKHVVICDTTQVQNSYLLHITMSIMKHSDSFRLISTFDMDTRNGQGISIFDMDIRYAQNF